MKNENVLRKFRNKIRYRTDLCGSQSLVSFSLGIHSLTVPCHQLAARALRHAYRRASYDKFEASWITSLWLASSKFPTVHSRDKMSTNNNQYGKEVKPKWKNPVAENSKITKLSGAKLQSLVSNDISACTALTLSNRGITKLEDLTGFREILHRVDLSNNAITRLQGFSATPGISMLNVSSNELSGDASLEDLRYLTELRTLNIGNNPNIKHIRSHVAKPLQKLQGNRLTLFLFLHISSYTHLYFSFKLSSDCSRMWFWKDFFPEIYSKFEYSYSFEELN